MTEQEIKERLASNWLVINAAKQLVLFIKEKLNEGKSISTKEDQVH
ncbi:DNA binding protein [Acinetobacter phage vB_AbaA_LLY]|uniref:DNA binding protein n=1 Tax=Acinetobacter phage vB_AbaA_LLY TaxID=2966626 RepID=A0AC61ZU79_9CAUD